MIKRVHPSGWVFREYRKSYRASSSTRVLGSSAAGLWLPKSSAVSTDFSNWRLSHGLVMKSNAPNCIPLTANSMEPHAVIRITGAPGQNTCTFCNSTFVSLVANEVHIHQHQVGPGMAHEISAASGKQRRAFRVPPASIKA